MTSFSDLGLSPEVLKAVADTGYDTATPIQVQAIPVALQGRDVLGIAQTGTGKTAAFTLPMIDRLAAGRSKARMPRSLVLAPTRELADQVAASFDKYSKYHRLTWALLIGGVSFDDQTAKLDRGVDVLIATPGRLLDHFERGKLLLTGVQIMVVDEADRMLDMGFIPDLERIFKLTPANKQTLFFSATMPPEITRLTTQFLRSPQRIEAARPATTAETIEQFVVQIPRADPKAKRTALRALVARDDVKNGIVFCNRKSEVDIVAKSLKVHGFDAAPIHGDLDQSVRMRTLDDFRQGRLKLLVASDVAARGLDIPDVSHVFNYDVPHHADDYVHRIGRTGRAGRRGQTFMLVTPADSRNYDKVLKLTKKEPAECPLDLDWSAVEVDDRSRERKSDRGRRGERDRGADRGRGRKPAEPRAEPTAAVEALEARPAHEPAPKAARGRPERERERERPQRERERERGQPERDKPEAHDRERGRPERDKPEAHDRERGRPERGRPEAHDRERGRPERGRPEAHDRERGRPERGRPEAHERERAPVGFGADTPAFLLRAAPVAKTVDADAEAE
jgi:superfamily II DNA/RNA helicase